MTVAVCFRIDYVAPNHSRNIGLHYLMFDQRQNRPQQINMRCGIEQAMTLFWS